MKFRDWPVLLIFLVLLPLSSAQEEPTFRQQVERFAEESDHEAFGREITRLEKNVPGLAAHFNGLEWGRFQQYAYLLWAAARESDFDLEWMKHRYPKLTALDPEVLVARKTSRGGGQLLLHVASYDWGETRDSLHLLSGRGPVPVMVSRHPSTAPSEWKGWVDLQRPSLELSYFKLVRRKNGCFVVMHHYYHPFPGDKTWPKFLLWLKVDDDRLALDRLERYDLPASEDLIRPKYLGQTVYPQEAFRVPMMQLRY